MKALSRYEDAQALEWYGSSFTKLPRNASKLAFSREKRQRMLGRLLLSLICLCFFVDGQVVLNKKKVVCLKGEYVGSFRHLAEVTDISYGSVRRLLTVLSGMGLIVLTLIEGGCRIRICGYDRLMVSSETKTTTAIEKTPGQLHAEQVHALRGDKKSEVSTSKTMN